MRVAFVSQFDTDDVHAWSGIPYHMVRALAAAGLDVTTIGPLATQATRWVVAKHAFYKLVRRRSFSRDREPAVVEAYARQAAERMADSQFDVVFAVSSLPVARLKTNLPVVFWTDATYAALVGEYVGNLAAESRRNGMAFEREAIHRARLVLYGSQWAADSAVHDFGADPAKVKVVPFGANLDAPPASDAVAARIAARPADRCQLLFVGVDWARKGGAVAVEVAREMNHLGVPTTLTVVGCQPPADPPLPDFVRPVGFISKSTEEGRRRMDDLFAAADFFILPSRAEAMGLVFGEASAFGVPSLATRVGGIPSVVTDGTNGHLFDPTAPPRAWAEKAVSLLRNPAAYRTLAASARDEFVNRLSWQAAAKRVVELLGEVV